MSLSRRGFFRVMFGAGAAAVLAPVVKLMGAPPSLKYRQLGMTRASFQFGFTGWKDLPHVEVAPITLKVLQDAFAVDKYGRGN